LTPLCERVSTFSVTAKPESDEEIAVVRLVGALEENDGRAVRLLRALDVDVAAVRSLLAEVPAPQPRA
jgi:Clp amino terminal domain, pathogenicity island component